MGAVPEVVNTTASPRAGAAPFRDAHGTAPRRLPRSFVGLLIRTMIAAKHVDDGLSRRDEPGRASAIEPSMIWKMAIRNVLREAHRTRLTALSLGFGAFFLVAGGGLVSGLTASGSRGLREGLAGDLQVFDASNPVSELTDEPPSGFAAVAEPEEVERLLLSDPDVRAVAPRLVANGMLISGELRAPAVLVGVDPARESEVCRPLGAALGSADAGARTIALGPGIAERLRSGRGRRVTLLLPTADGMFEGDELEVSSVYAPGGLPLPGEIFAFLPLSELRSLLSGSNRPTSLAVALAPGADVSAARERLQRTLDSARLHVKVRSWTEMAGSLLDAGRIGSLGLVISNALLMFMIALGVVNTILIVVLERTRDIGMMLALGTPRSRVLCTLLLEAAIVAGFSAAAGTLLGGATCLAAGKVGIPAFTRAMTFAFGGDRLYPVVTAAQLAVGFLLVTGLGPLAALYPAVRAIRVDPVRALRST